MQQQFWDALRHPGGRQKWCRCGRAAALLTLVALFVLPSGHRAGALGAPANAHAQTTDKTAAAALQNAGFEAKDLTGWTASPSELVTVIDTHAAVNSNTVYGPAEGAWFARLEPSEPDVYTTLTQSFSAQAGDVLSCWSFFDGEDVPAWNDTSDVRILAGTNPVATVYHEDILSSGDLGNLPWSQWAYTVTVAGTYAIEARIANAVDNSMPSYLGLDGCKITRGTQATSFNATSADGRVALTWQPANETDTTGFNLYRAITHDGSYDKVNAVLIAVKGNGDANVYSYDDFPGAGIFFYRLETVTNSGATQQQGPVQVQSTSPFRRPPRQPVPPHQ